MNTFIKSNIVEINHQNYISIQYLNFSRSERIEKMVTVINTNFTSNQ